MPETHEASWSAERADEPSSSNGEMTEADFPNATGDFTGCRGVQSTVYWPFGIGNQFVSGLELPREKQWANVRKRQPSKFCCNASWPCNSAAPRSVIDPSLRFQTNKVSWHPRIGLELAARAL